jgi:hypothetical protein
MDPEERVFTKWEFKKNSQRQDLSGVSGVVKVGAKGQEYPGRSLWQLFHFPNQI